MKTHHHQPQASQPISLSKIVRPQVEVLLGTSSAREAAQMGRWDALSVNQKERTAGNNRQAGVNDKQEELLLKHPHLAQSSSLILDVGAGIGCATDILRTTSAQVVALELSPEMAKRTAEDPIVPFARVLQYSISGAPELSELKDNPILPGSVDAIICYGAFQNFVDRGENPGDFDEATAKFILQRKFDLLKPGGVYSAEYLLPQGVNFHEQTTVIDPARFRALCEEVGFVVSRDERVFGYHHDQLKVDVYYQLLEGCKPNHETILEGFWDKQAPDQTQGQIRSGYRDSVIKVQQDLVSRYPEIFREGNKALDIGSGPGDSSVVLRELGMSTTGIDISSRQLELSARSQPAYDSLHKISITGSQNPCSLGLEAASFNAVLLFGNLQNFIGRDKNGDPDYANAGLAFDRINELLEKGGICSAVFLPEQPDVSFGRVTVPINPEKLIEQVEKAGFKVELHSPLPEFYRRSGSGEAIDYYRLDIRKK